LRGGALPPALLFAALAFALAFAPRAMVLPAVVLAALLAGAATALRLPTGSTEVAFLACWTVTVVAAASVHLPNGLPRAAAIVLAGLAGLAAGVIIRAAGTPLDLARAVPLLALVWPARWLRARGGGIGVKVVASWLIAVAILAATLPVVPTPGYVPDHME